MIPKHLGIGMGFAWICRCDCGVTCQIDGRELRCGKVKSCGCLRRDIAGAQNRTHGKSKTDEYKIWLEIKKRCFKPYQKFYHHYGGRGITLCLRWRKFSNFLKDMGVRPSKNHSIDRIDNNKGYHPANCKWSTQREQCNNSRRNRIVEFRGRSYTIAQLTRKLRLPYEMVRVRIVDKGWTAERATTTPARVWKTKITGIRKES